jgi:hypothetical protein
MARGQRDLAKERHWRHQVAAWRRSGQTIRAYCLAEGLSEPSFYSWRRILAERQETRPAKVVAGSTGSASSTSLFVPVRLVEEPCDKVPALDVVVRGGRIVRVSAGFSAQALREVVAALEDLPC